MLEVNRVEPFDDVLRVMLHVHRDERGFFAERWSAAAFAERGLPPFVQENHSRSRHGVLRGLHFQARAGPLGLDRWPGVLGCVHEQGLGVRAAERGCRADRTKPDAVPAYTLSGVLRPRLACFLLPL